MSPRLTSSMLASVGAITCAVPVAVAETATPETYTEPAPKELDGVGVSERLGVTIPLDLAFTDEAGRAVKLRDYFGSEKPVLLTFNYSDCSMLCSMQLSALTKALKQISLSVGDQFRIVTIALDHTETADKTAATKERYISQFAEENREQVAEGWSFLRGKEADIRALADAVGFEFRYVPNQKQYAHPATLIFVSTAGRVNGYIHGIDYTTASLQEFVLQAGLDHPSTSIGFALSCLKYNSTAGSYSNMGRNLMKYAAVAFVVLLLASFGGWQLARSRKSRRGSLAS